MAKLGRDSAGSSCTKLSCTRAEPPPPELGGPSPGKPIVGFRGGDRHSPPATEGTLARPKRKNTAKATSRSPRILPADREAQAGAPKRSCIGVGPASLAPALPEAVDGLPTLDVPGGGSEGE